MSHTATQSNCAPITMDIAYLASAKKALIDGDVALKAPYDKLITDATALLALAPESVTYKKLLPASGDKHDYLSLAPYWWPDPSKPDGLPYISRDGEFNPASKNGDSDSVRMQTMCMGCQSLSLAYYFSDDLRFANKAAEFIRCWFLDPATAMRPHLNFGQAVMGIATGRAAGLIDTRNLWMVIDAALLISQAGALSNAEMDDLKAWFRAFNEWMQTSEIGIDEFNAYNNHGTFYDMELACHALFYGDLDLVKSTVKRAISLRITAAIAADGRQHAELERTTPFHYSAFNLDAMSNIARYGEQVGIDVWRSRQSGRGMRNGINYLCPFITAPETWPYKELRHIELELALPLLLKAARAYGEPSYAALAAQIPETVLTTQEFIALYRPIGLPHPSTHNCVDLLLWHPQ